MPRFTRMACCVSAVNGERNALNCSVPTNITAIIPAGGRSRRFERDTALEPIAGEPIIRRVIRPAAEAIQFSEIVVVVSSLERAASLPLDPDHRIAVDSLPRLRPARRHPHRAAGCPNRMALVVALSDARPEALRSFISNLGRRSALG